MSKVKDYWQGVNDGRTVRDDYDVRGDERTVPSPDIEDRSSAYQKGWWDGFNKLDATPPPL
jgi:hypothetical protein